MSVHDAPLPRTAIDEALPWLRGLLGVIFVAYSAASTIRIGATDLFWLFPATQNSTIGYGPDAYWYTSLIAVVVFLGQIATSERYPKVYRLFLWPDAFYTGRGVQAALQTAFTVLAGAVVGDNQYAQLAGLIISWPAGLFFGYYVAKWGEILLFGKRRKLRGTSNAKEK